MVGKWSKVASSLGIAFRLSQIMSLKVKAKILLLEFLYCLITQQLMQPHVGTIYRGLKNHLSNLDTFQQSSFPSHNL